MAERSTISAEDMQHPLLHAPIFNIEPASGTVRALPQIIPSVNTLDEYYQANKSRPSSLTVQHPLEPVEKSQTLPIESKAMALTTSLTDLPTEILVSIFSCLDTAPPSKRQILELPSEYIHSPADSGAASIKQISLTCRRLRLMTIPLLFVSACVQPEQTNRFLTFVRTHSILQIISTLLVYVGSSTLQQLPPTAGPPWWMKLLNAIPMTRFQLVCPPAFFARLTGIQDSMGDEWAFKMPYQSVVLECNQDAIRTRTGFDETSSNILVARPWTSLTMNEGSSLKAYTTYEYFLRRTPSLLTSLYESRSLESNALFSRLTHFSFVAIFPFYNHVDEILKCVRKMVGLRSLFIKLCPEPDRSVLQDAIDDAQGHFDISDPWNEFDTSYSLISHTVIYLTIEGVLETLHVDDVKMKFFQKDLENAVEGRIQQWWSYEGRGLWHRKKSS